MSGRKGDFAGFAIELLAPLGRVTARRMFGGHGVYCDGLFIAIVHGDTLWLKSDAAARGDFLRAGSIAFTYERAGRETSLGFYSAPEGALESPVAMQPWGRLALAAALRARAARRPKRQV